MLTQKKTRILFRIGHVTKKGVHCLRVCVCAHAAKRNAKQVTVSRPTDLHRSAAVHAEKLSHSAARADLGERV